MVLNNNNSKIIVVIKQLPEEVRNDDKYTTYLREVTKEELLAFCISYARSCFQNWDNILVWVLLILYFSKK